MHLDAMLADEPLTGGLEPRLGEHHLRTLTITGFPSATFPDLLDELNRLAFEYMPNILTGKAPRGLLIAFSICLFHTAHHLFFRSV